MSRNYSIEFFQGVGSADNSTGGTDLSSAYKKGASVKNLISSSGVGATPPETAASAAPANAAPVAAPVAAPQGMQLGNIWEFLGIDNLSLKKKKCIYNCGMDVMGCMERCANPDCRSQQNLSHEQCKYGCMRKGISCSTNCISEIEPPPDPTPMFETEDDNFTHTTTSALNISTTPATMTTSSLVEDNGESIEELCLKHYDVLPNEVKGAYANLDNYAPFDMRVWPQDGKFGWTLSELNKLKRNGYDVPNTIEVNMNHSLYPIRNSGKPVLEFNYASE